MTLKSLVHFSHINSLMTLVQYNSSKTEHLAEVGTFLNTHTHAATHIFVQR